MTIDKEACFDPDRDSRLDPRNLKGLAHPLRVRLLGALRERGPATASMLASMLGESSGATSYHLRQLADFGFIVEDEGRGSGRERWWKAARPSTYFDYDSFSRDAESSMLGAEFLKSVAGGASRRMLEWIDALPEAPEDWARAGALSDWALRISPEEALELEREIEALVRRYPRHDPAGPEESGRGFVAVQLQILPKLSGGRR